MENRECQCCGHEKPLSMFAATARGTVRKTCKSCYAGQHRNINLREANREFNRLVSWRVPA